VPEFSYGAAAFLVFMAAMLSLALLIRGTRSERGKSTSAPPS
jgi:hypothetical protein